MLGLLIKDFKLMKNQKTFFFLMLFLAIAMLFAEFGSAFVISYFTIMSSMFVVSSISYDEFDNGNAFLFSLPFTRKEYALEKYVFASILGIGAWLTATVLAVGIAFFKTQQLPGADWLLENLIYIFLVFLMAAFMIPVQLKFGGEKGRIALILAVLSVMVIGYFIFEGIQYLKVLNLTSIVAFLMSLSVYAYLAIGLVFLIIILTISYRLSCRIVAKKEF